MRWYIALAAFAVGGCSWFNGGPPVQEPQPVVASFMDVMKACSARLTDKGLIDQAAVAQAGWTLISRKTYRNAEEQTVALTSFPALRSGEYEKTIWTHPVHKAEIDLARWNEQEESRVPDNCGGSARVANDKAIAAVIAAITQKMSRNPDRQGDQPIGGDFLTPRSDVPGKGYYWALPQHDVYVETRPPNGVIIDIVAMADRAQAYKSEYQTPLYRIPSPPEGLN